MSRDDSILYSGMNSTSASRVISTRVKKAEEKVEKQNKLTPAAEVIAEVIARERERVVQEIANLPITIDTNQENVKEALMVYQRTLRFIDDFQTGIANALRKAGR